MRVDLKPPAWATHLLSDLTDWQRRPLPVAEITPFELPDDVYFEYAYQDARGERRPDPVNNRPRLNPWWPYACHLAGPAYRHHPLAEPSRPWRQERIRRLILESRYLGDRRVYYTFTPAAWGRTVLPQVLFQDGKAYLAWGRVLQIYETLLARREVRPAHLVFVPPVDRVKEYAFNDAYLQFLAEEILPHVEATCPCDGSRVAWGASLGGLVAARLAWSNAASFSTVVTQSGAFLYDPEQDLQDPFAGREWFAAQVVAGARRPLRWFLECGTLEWLRGSNVRLHEVLRARGCEASLVLRHAGHNWVNWRNGIADALRYALGGGSEGR